MGLDSALITELLFPEVGPGVFIPLKDLQHSTEDVIMLPAMEYRFGINHNGSTDLTTDQACEYFLRKILKFQGTTSPVHSVLLLFDKSRFVPKEKRRVQEQRRESSRVEAYPPGCRLIPAGIVTPEGQESLLDAKRLAITGYLWHELSMVLETYLIDYHTRTPFLANVYLNYDRGEGNPTEYILYSEQGRLGNVFPSHAARNTDQIGEMDLLVNHYLSEFSDFHCILHSEDGDHLPLLLSHLQRHTPPRELWWIRRDKHRVLPEGRKRKDPDDPAKALYVIDVVAAYMAVYEGISSMSSLRFEDAPQLSPHRKGLQRVDAFILLCILNGTDYVEKRLLSHQFGLRDIVAATCQAWPELNNAMRGGEKEEADVRALEVYIYHLFDQKRALFKSGGGPPILHISASGTTVNTQTLPWYAVALSQQKKHRVPTSEDIQLSLTQIMFNVEYWR